MPLRARLKNPEALVRLTPLINGRFLPSSNSAEFAVYNPSAITGTPLTAVTSTTLAQATEAITAARTAFPTWSSRTGHDRGQILTRYHDLITRHASDLASLVTLENGKAVSEARGEIAYGASYVRWFAQESTRAYGTLIPAPLPGRQLMAVKRPVGVVAAITPWNFPCAMVLRKVAAALASGCTVVLKPAPETPLVALALGQLALDAGVPPGVLNVLPCSPSLTPDIGTLFATSPHVTFTGSTAVGRTLMSLSGSRVKRLSLELGGHAPFLVFPSASETKRNVEKAVEMLMLAKFRNAGQTCISPNRVYVHADIHDQFVSLLTKRVQSLTVGDGFDQNTKIGPLIHVDAAVKVQRHVDDAVAQGATLVCGGTILSEHGPNYYAPTILTQCNQNMLLAREETFGPVVPVIKFTSEDQAVRMANDTEFGLASYVYTTDMAQSWRVSERLDYGMVGVNEGLISYEVAPFGGVKQSGFGREGSFCGMDDYTHIKYICIRNE